MSDPLLSSLCRVCNTQQPKYCCPRCGTQTCSLACSKRHKVWSECDGIRDPTAYKPKHELTTPAGIDHDYNFISSIERRIERADKYIVEEKGLLDSQELFRNGPPKPKSGKRRALDLILQQSRVTVERVPSGMQRSKENGTYWNKARRFLIWQVEWLREDGSRIMSQTMERVSVGKIYATLLQNDEKRMDTTADERRKTKKRKAETLKEESRSSKRAKLCISNTLVHQSIFQNPIRSSWNLSSQDSEEVQKDSFNKRYAKWLSSLSYDAYPPSSGYYFYLHRPCTSLSGQKVLIPLHPSAPLSVLLQNRVVLEFPTIYVLSSPPSSLPNAFTCEDQHLDKQPRGSLYHVSADLEKNLEDSSSGDSHCEDSGSDDYDFGGSKDLVPKAEIVSNYYNLRSSKNVVPKAETV